MMLVVLVFAACRNQAAHADKGLKKDLLIKNGGFVIKEVSSMKIYPGVQNENEEYTEHWIIQLSGPSQAQNKAFLILDHYSISLADIESAKGVVIGSDQEEYKLEMDVLFPLNKHYRESNIAQQSYPILLIEKDSLSFQLPLKEINYLDPIYLPTQSD
jgi:hypothetical protein